MITIIALHSLFADQNQNLAVFTYYFVYGIYISILLYLLVIIFYLKDKAIICFFCCIFALLIYYYIHLDYLNYLSIYLFELFLINSFSAHHGIEKYLYVVFAIPLALCLLYNQNNYYLNEVIPIVSAVLYIIILIYSTYQFIRNEHRILLFIGINISIAAYVLRLLGQLSNIYTFVSEILLLFGNILLAFCIIDKYKKYKMENEQIKIKAIETERNRKAKELEFLQAQIKPHFIHNTITTIVALCSINQRLASQLIGNLSDYLKFSFDFNDFTNFVSLDEELKLILAYVSIEKVRFKNKFHFKYIIDDVKDLKIPPLILQPLIENAIKHGLNRGIDGGRVELQVKNLGNEYSFSVFNNGNALSEEKIQSLLNRKWERGMGIGIININSRLREIYNTSLMIENRDGGVCVNFIIPNKGIAM